MPLSKRLGNKLRAIASQDSGLQQLPRSIALLHGISKRREAT